MDNEKLKTSFYFPHDIGASNDPKIVALRIDFGFRAVGMFWSLVEALHKEQTGELPSKIITSLITDFYSNEKSVYENEAKKFEAALFELGLLCRCKNGNVTNNRVKENIIERKKKSQKAKLSAMQRWSNTSDKRTHANAMRTQCERNARKERKGNEIKGNENNEVSEINNNNYKKEKEKKEKIFQMKNQIAKKMQMPSITYEDEKKERR